MKTVWFKGLNPGQKEKVRADFLSCTAFRIRLKELLADKIENARNASRKSDSYDSPSWALMQADSIGYERALIEIISMISDEKVQKAEKIK